jgi:hypothetical protein
MHFSTSLRRSKMRSRLLWAFSPLLFDFSGSDFLPSQTEKQTGVASHTARICSRSARSLSTLNLTALRGLVSGLGRLGKSKKRLRVTKGVLDIVCPFRVNRCLLVAASFPLRNCRAWPVLGVFSWVGGVR